MSEVKQNRKKTKETFNGTQQAFSQLICSEIDQETARTISHNLAGFIETLRKWKYDQTSDDKQIRENPNESIN